MSRYKFIFISALCLSFTTLYGKDKMKNLLQVKVITECNSPDLESSVNKFLIEKKLTKDDLVSVNYCRTVEHKSISIVYEVKMEDK